MGSLALKAKSFDRATSLLTKALNITETFKPALPYTHLLYNIGNLYMAIRDHKQALEFYLRALEQSPFIMMRSFEDYTDIEGLKFNS